jgi:hypothetical protein
MAMKPRRSGIAGETHARERGQRPFSAATCITSCIGLGVLLRSHRRREANPAIAPPDQNEIARVNLYGVALGLAATEAQLIWARFNAMLVANTLVGAIIVAPVAAGHPPPERNSDLIWLIAGVAGLCLAVIWQRLTVWGWRAAKIPWEYASQFHWEYSENLADHYAQKLANSMDPTGQDQIQRWALRVIWLFIIAYASVIGLGSFFLLHGT